MNSVCQQIVPVLFIVLVPSHTESFNFILAIVFILLMSQNIAVSSAGLIPFSIFLSIQKHKAVVDLYQS